MIDLANLVGTPATKQKPAINQVEVVQDVLPQQEPDNMLELRKAYEKAKTSPVDIVLVYGAPKVGKTAFAGSVAKMDCFDTVYYFDVEGSATTLLNPEIGMTDKDLGKIKLIPISDTRSTSAAIESLLKYFSMTKEETVSICKAHSKVACVRCKKSGGQIYTIPAVHNMTDRDCIVIDTISQVGVSALWAGMELARREEISTGKPNAFAKYTKQGELLLDLLTMLQATRNVTVICTAHSYTLDDDNPKKPTITVPAIGTQNFSRNVGKFFTSVVFMSVESKQFKAGSTPTYKLNTLAGSRLGNKVEKIKDRPPVMADLLSL